jgi:transcriptional regulator with XRE-family HTH domain
VTPNEVKQARANLGFTQKQLAEKLGISVETVKRIERIGASTIQALAIKQLIQQRGNNG